MKMNGIEFFPFPSQNSTALKLIEAKFKLKGVAIYVKLLQKIFAEEGYFYTISDDVILLLKQEFNLPATDNIISELINDLILRGIFSKEMYENYSILTSDDIQKEYLNAVRKRKSINLKKEYLLEFATNFLKKAEEIKKTAEEMRNTAEEIDKGKESKEKENKHTKITERNKVTDIKQVSDDFSLSIEKFKNATNKYCSDVKVLPIDINMDLLIEKVTKSDFLMGAKNFTLKTCLKYYDKILAGAYDNDTIKQKISLDPPTNLKSKSRKYSQEELNSFYTNPDEISFN